MTTKESKEMKRYFTIMRNREHKLRGCTEVYNEYNDKNR